MLSSDELADLDYPASIQMTTESGNEYTHHYNYYWSTASTWKNAAMIDYGYYTGTNYVLAQEMTSTYSETAADEINVYLVSKNGGSDEWYYTTVLHYGDYEYEYYLQGDFTDLGKIITIEEFIAATEMSEEDAITLRALVVDSEMVYYWTDYAGQEIKYNSHLYGSTNVDHLNEELGYDVSEYGATTHLYFTHTCDYVLDESQTVTATCQTEGKEVYVCSICGDEYIKNLGLDLNNHEGKIDGTYVAPTYEAKGYERMYYTCCDAEVSYKEYAQLNDNLIHVDESVDVNGDGYDDETGSIIAIYVNVYIGKSTATGEETETITKELFDKVLVPFAVVSFIVDGEYVIDLADLHPTALGVDLGEDYAWISYYSTSDTDDDNGIFDADTTETLTVIDGEEFVLVYVDMGDGEGGDGEDTGEVDPSIPDAGDDEEENDCDCICHSSNWFDQIIYKIVRLFWNIFDINKVCKCGKTYHYIT